MEPRPLTELLREREQLNKQIGASLRAERQKAGITQSELAAHLGINQTYLSRIENGHKTPRTPTAMRYLNAIQERSTDGYQVKGRAQKDAGEARRD